MINSPTELTDCVLWLDANDESSLTFQPLTADEIAILSSWGIDYSTEEKVVDVWTDKSVNATPITMSATARPKFSAGTLNGNNVLRFDGNDYLMVPDDIFSYDNMTMFIVGNCKDLSRSRSVVMTNIGGNSDLLRITVESGVNTSNFRLESGRQGGDDFVNTYFPAQENTNFIYSLQSLKGYLEGKVNGMSAGIARTSCAGLIKSLRLGAGKGSSEKQGIKGVIAEFIIYNRAITQTELNDVLSYLSNKWSIDLLTDNPSA